MSLVFSQSACEKGTGEAAGLASLWVFRETFLGGIRIGVASYLGSEL